MQVGFSELKMAAADAAENTVPATADKQGAALVCKDGRLYTGHGVTFADGVTLSACDMALAAALTDGRQKFLAVAFCGMTPPDKAALKRLAALGDVMVLLTCGNTHQQMTLSKLLSVLGE